MHTQQRGSSLRKGPGSRPAGRPGVRMPTECMAVGVISEGVRELAHLIRGMCFQYGTIKLHEVVLRVPLQLGHSATSVKLQRRLQQPDASNPLREPLPDRCGDGGDGATSRGGVPAAVTCRRAPVIACGAHCCAVQAPAYSRGVCIGVARWQAGAACHLPRLLKSPLQLLVGRSLVVCGQLSALFLPPAWRRACAALAGGRSCTRALPCEGRP